MNKLIYIFILTLSAGTIATGQGLTEKYVSFDLRILRGNLTPEDGTLALSFTENSIRELPYSFEKTYNGSISYSALEIGLKFGKYKGMSYSLDLSAPLSGQGKGKFGFSVGYNYPIPVGIMDLLIRPSLGITTGSSNLKVGSIDVDTTGIIIKDTDYIDREVCVHISSGTTYLIPKLETTLLIEQKFGISLSAAYDLNISNKQQRVEFIATDFDDTDLDFSDEFIDLNFNGSTPTDNLYTSDGLTFAVGISWYYNRE